MKTPMQKLIVELKTDLMEAVWEATDSDTGEVGTELLSFLIDDVLENNFNLKK